ncbi:MAG: polyhydroxyalkanoate depolymerase, partial [Burkholderiales bacterium]|nr:polyhydroxyalkanoate depolymerase [Burkholderiales bacterium]
KHLEAKGAGHYGIFSGRRWRDIVYPEVKSFILANALVQPSAQVPAVATKPASKKAARKA